MIYYQQPLFGDRMSKIRKLFYQDVCILTTSEKYKRERDKKEKKKSSSSTFAYFHYTHTFIVTSIMIPTGYHYTWLSEEMLMMGYCESR